ncbi:MAG: 50S ribosomal protein L10 [Candidatus Helarchaeota archaeon]|nr:50S ribosomal protein L10 [Candidatus Helarchaeota archaeon]
MAAESKQISQIKLEEVQLLKELLDQHDVICLAKMNKLGAHQLQSIRKKLAGKIIIRMTKNRLFKIAASKSNKKNIKEFMERIEGSTSYIFTKMNPFKLKLFLDDNKVKAPAKGGDKAPKDIMVPEGSTGFPPGPMISEFKEVGIDSMVKRGSIYIKRDTVVAKKGEEVSRMLALVLSRLNISPMEIGLNLYAAYDKGVILEESDLDISLKSTLIQLKNAIWNALSLSLEVGYPTEENIQLLIQKAVMNAKGLSLSAGLVTKDTISEILVKAKANALALSNMILKVNPDALPPDFKQSVEKIGISETKMAEPEKKEKEKEEEDKSKDIGLGGLFD